MKKNLIILFFAVTSFSILIVFLRKRSSLRETQTKLDAVEMQYAVIEDSLNTAKLALKMSMQVSNSLREEFLELELKMKDSLLLPCP